MVVVCEGYRGVVVYLELLLWKFTDASRDWSWHVGQNNRRTVQGQIEVKETWECDV